MLLYFNAVLDLIFGFGGFGILLPLAEALGAFGLANERKWGYWVALGAASLPVLLYLQVIGSGVYFSALITLLVRGVIVAFLLHPASRSYKTVYFS